MTQKLWPARLTGDQLPALFARELRRRWFIRQFVPVPCPTNPALSPCLVFTGPRHQDMGYGKLDLGGHTFATHRVAWVYHHGQWPGEFKVCHRCDNPPCGAVDHLFLGTTADNNRDMFAKGRNNPPIGTRAGSAILTDALVLAMRARRQSGLTYAEIAAEFSVSKTTARYAIQGVTWSHLPTGLPSPNGEG